MTTGELEILEQLLPLVQATVRQEITAWSGPMPEPTTLEHYERIIPGAAERMLQMAEVSVRGQNDIDSRLADAEIKGADEGRRMAFALTLIAVAASIGFFIVGNVIGGITLVSLPVVQLVRSLLSGR